MRRSLLVLLLLALVAGHAPGTVAQPTAAPSVIAAEQSFDRGLRAFRAGDYQAAHAAFTRVVEGFEFNQRTTAAHLMAGRSLFAASDLEGTVSLMTNFIASYPRSRYVDEARQLRRRAQERQREEPATLNVTNLGVLLPLGGEDGVFSQALFNGIRLAIDAHNERNPDQPVRLIFRDSGGEAASAAVATAALARAGAGVIIGPLYSEEAIAAGGVAEREGVVLISPMATDERVSEGRRFVFQANPTFDIRGRTMARYANGQGLDRIGIVAVRGSLAETMAQAFVDQAVRNGQQVLFTETLPAAEAWFQLPERMGTDRFSAVDALYLPVSGSAADDQASGALRGLDFMAGETGHRPVVLGNAEWNNLGPARALAGEFGAVFENDYYVHSTSDANQAFVTRYRNLASVAPDRLAYAGYDVSRLVLSLNPQGRNSRDLADAIRGAGQYDGLAHRIHFDGSQVNQALFIMRHRGAEVELVRQ